MELLDLLLFIILLSILIFVHEGGHFLLAKLFGVKVEEFGFGIPPRVWGRKIGDTVYSLNLLPIGGFVRLKGEEGETLGFGGADSFAVKSKFKRAFIIAAGALGNFVLAWLVFSLLWGLGTPVPAGKVLVNDVAPGSPAEISGIKPGDYILSLNGQKTETAGELIELTRANLGKNAILQVEMVPGRVSDVEVLVRTEPPEGQGPIGFSVATAFSEQKVPLWETPFAGLKDAGETLGSLLKGFAQTVAGLFRGDDVQVGGPVAIYALTSAVADGGFKPFINFMAILSLNLVVVNLLPIPALDGGRILFIAVEAVRGKRLSPKTEHLVNSVGFAFLIVLIIILSIKDIRTFF